MTKIFHKNVVRLLTRAREIITDSESWTKGTSARDQFDVECHQGTLDPDACKWCMWGAIEYAAMELDLDAGGFLTKVADSMIRQIIPPFISTQHDYRVEFRTIADFNDGPERKHEHVIQVLNAGILFHQGQC